MGLLTLQTLLKILSRMNAEFLAPVISTGRYRSQSEVTTMRRLSDNEEELGLSGDVNDSGMDVVGDCREQVSGERDEKLRRIHTAAGLEFGDELGGNRG
jgi:hypothetical protein